MESPIEYLLNTDVDNLSFEFILSSFQRGMMILMTHKIMELGIDFPQNYRYLEFIKEHDNIIQKDLANIFNINQSTVTRSLNALEDEGFIERVMLEGNKKNKVVKLTDKGENIIEEVESYKNNIEEQIFKGFSHDDIRKLKLMNVELAKRTFVLINKSDFFRK
ncbi:MAG: MarR family winged helix-turn-helix transcriptional regulator [Methanobrevibacter sp.]